MHNEPTNPDKRLSHLGDLHRVWRLVEASEGNDALEITFVRDSVTLTATVTGVDSTVHVTMDVHPREVTSSHVHVNAGTRRTDQEPTDPVRRR